MENKNIKILVLSDLKGSTNATLKSSLGLAKITGGDIEFFHVTEATDIVNSDSQLTAMRNINKQFLHTDKKIQKLLDPIRSNHNINIKYNYAFGNVRNEIEERIDALQPEIIVIGKRKAKKLNLTGDRLTDFILKRHKGIVFIAAKDKNVDLESSLSIGTLNDFSEVSENSLAKSLISRTKKPLKTFEIGNTSNHSQIETSINNQNIVKYVFEDSPNVVNTLAEYLVKNNINLFCFNRKNKKQKKAIYAKDLIDKVDVSFLVA